MKKIKLTQNKYALVDYSDYQKLIKYKWYANKLGKTFYAFRNRSIKGGLKRHLIGMHNEILGNSFGKDIDHINCNGLNNQRKNLRFVTKSENQLNRGLPINNTSGMKCIGWAKDEKVWTVIVTLNNKQKNLGRFNKLSDAKRTYKEFAERNYKTFLKIK